MATAHSLGKSPRTPPSSPWEARPWEPRELRGHLSWEKSLWRQRCACQRCVLRGPASHCHRRETETRRATRWLCLPRLQNLQSRSREVRRLQNLKSKCSSWFHCWFLRSYDHLGSTSAGEVAGVAEVVKARIERSQRQLEARFVPHSPCSTPISFGKPAIIDLQL